MFRDDAKPTASNYRARAAMIVEAAKSGEAIATAAGHKRMAREFGHTVLWGESLLRMVKEGKR